MSQIRDVIDLAKRNGGVVTTQEAMALGMTQTTLDRRVGDGVFVRVGRGILALPGTATRPDLALRAACKQLGAVVSHTSAARIHGLEPVEESAPVVTVSHRGTNRFPGVTVHQSTDLLPVHIETLGPWTLTTPARTVIDLAQVLKPRRLARVVDNGLAAGKLDAQYLAELFASLSRKGKPGMKAMRAILEPRVGAAVVPKTELEDRLTRLINDSGVPIPVEQFSAPWLQPIEGRVDLAYIEKRIVIEADSRRWHTLFDAFELDRRRDNAAQLAGWIVLRFTWRMIHDEPSVVVATIRDAWNSR